MRIARRALFPALAWAAHAQEVWTPLFDGATLEGELTQVNNRAVVSIDGDSDRPLVSDERGRWLRVALATTHLPLRAVPDAITPDGLALARPAGAPRAQRDLPGQLRAQMPPRLHIDRLVDRLVTHPHLRPVGELFFESGGDLLR